MAFHVEAVGENLSYQWQFYNPTEKTWKNSSLGNPKTDTLSVTATDARNGYRYRCIIMDDSGFSLTSDAATLTVSDKTDLEIVEQPVPIVTTPNSTALFHIEAVGENLSYQWQFYNPTEKIWKNSSLGNPKTDTLSVTATIARNGYRYRCILSDGTTTLTSNDVTLTVSDRTPLMIISQPQDVKAKTNANVAFHVEAEGKGISYQWQFYNPNEETWKNSSLGNPNTDTLSVQATASRNGYRYRCIITDDGGSSLTSDATTLTVSDKTELEIIEQPVSVVTTPNSTALFHIEAVGENLSYQWQFYNPTDKTWKNSSLGNPKTDTFSNESGLGSGDTITGYTESSADDFASTNNFSFTALEKAFDENDHDIYLKMGESTKINAEGTRLRFLSENSNIATVDNNGNVTAVEEGYCKIFVYDIKGRSKCYDIHVGTGRLELPMYQVLYPGNDFTLSSNIGFVTVQSNEDAFGSNYNWDNQHSFKAIWSATDEIFSYTDDGQAALTYANAIVDVIEAKNGITYTGDIRKDGALTGGVWYALSAGDTAVSVDLDITCNTPVNANIYAQYTTDSYYVEEQNTWYNSLVDSYNGYDSNDWVRTRG